MLSAPLFDPRMPSDLEPVAKVYSRKLASIGKGLLWGGGALFLVPLTQWMALGMAAALIGLAVILGRAYNRNVDDFLKQVSLAKLITIFAPAWRYLLMTTLLLGVGLGVEEWSLFAEYKHLFFALLASGVIWDIGRNLFSE